jgi:hypothetical protein
MAKETPPTLLHVELTELYDRARRAINQAQNLAADRDFILWWCGMQSQSSKPPSAMLDGPMSDS